MTNIIFKIYLIWADFLNWLRGLYRLGQFTYWLYKERIFQKGDPSLVLRTIQKFTSCAWGEYSETIVMGRTPVQSTALLHVLIDTWFETGSKTTLNQILEVLKNEFIERGGNGRK